jgi:hypothetical protein
MLEGFRVLFLSRSNFAAALQICLYRGLCTRMHQRNPNKDIGVQSKTRVKKYSTRGKKFLPGNKFPTSLMF